MVAVRWTGHKSFGSEDGYGTGNHVLHSGALQEKKQVDTSRREGEANQFSSAREEVCLRLRIKETPGRQEVGFVRAFSSPKPCLIYVSLCKTVFGDVLPIFNSTILGW